MNFKQCVADICDLIDQVDKGAISVESAKVTAIGTLSEYSDSHYERITKRLMERINPEGAQTA